MKHPSPPSILLALSALALAGLLLLLAGGSFSSETPAAGVHSAAAGELPDASQRPDSGANPTSTEAERSIVLAKPAQLSTLASGEVLVLVAEGESVVAFGGELVATPSNSALDTVATSSGSLRLAAGRWRLVGEGTRLSQTELHVTPASRTVVWAWQPFDRVVRVVDSERDTPIEGANVAWRASAGGETHELVTNDAGEAHFVGQQALGNPSGRFKVWAPGYSKRIVELHAQGTAPELLVQLEPVPADLAPLGELYFFDRSSDLPLAGVRISQAPISPEEGSSAFGKLALPGSLNVHSRIEITRSGYFTRRPYISDLLDAGGEVPMARPVPVQVLPDLNADGVLYVTWIEAPGEPGRFRFPGWRFGPPAAFTSGTPIELSLPEGEWVRFDATGKHGERATLDWQVVDAAAPVQLRPDADSQGELLILDVSSPDGGRLPEAKAVVSDQRLGDLALEPELDGTFRITRAEEIEGIDVFARGIRRLNLSQVFLWGEPGPAAGGRLTIRAEPSFDVPLTLVDTAGNPIAGLSVSLDSNIGLANSQKYPELGGDLPTEHPRWSVGLPPAPKGTSDAAGCVTLFGVQPGTYQLTPHLPAARGGNSPTPYRPAPFELTITDTTPLTATLARPLLARFSAIDGATGAPLPTASLTDLSVPFARSFSGSATPWTGWISATGGPFKISAPGHRPLELSSLELAGAPELVLWPSSGIRVRLTGSAELLAKLEGQALAVHHLAKPLPGTGGMRPVASKSTAIVRAGCLLIDLSPGDEIALPRMQLGSTELRFDPPRQAWQGETELEFKVSN